MCAAENFFVLEAALWNIQRKMWAENSMKTLAYKNDERNVTLIFPFSALISAEWIKSINIPWPNQRLVLNPSSFSGDIKLSKTEIAGWCSRHHVIVSIIWQRDDFRCHSSNLYFQAWFGSISSSLITGWTRNFQSRTNFLYWENPVITGLLSNLLLFAWKIKAPSRLR